MADDQAWFQPYDDVLTKKAKKEPAEEKPEKKKGKKPEKKPEQKIRAAGYRNTPAVMAKRYASERKIEEWRSL